MGRFFCIVCLSLIISLSSVSTALSKTTVTISPQFTLLSGTTDYSLDLKGPVIDTIGTNIYNGTLEIGSLLEFPLDTYLGGGVIEIIGKENKWRARLSTLVSMKDPSEKMRDSDWEGFEPFFPRTLWSFTESDAELTMKQFELLLYKLISKRPGYTINLILGGRLQKIEQVALGVAGFQYGFDPDTVGVVDTVFTFDVFQGQPVLTYDITYKMLLIGLGLETSLTPLLNWEASAMLMPAFYDDEDDHLLRKKLSTSSGNGIGFSGSTSATYYFKAVENSNRSFVRLAADYTTANLSGGQTQVWYETTPEADEGTTFTNIPHDVKTRQFTVSLNFGITF